MRQHVLFFVACAGMQNIASALNLQEWHQDPFDCAGYKQVEQPVEQVKVEQIVETSASVQMPQQVPTIDSKQYDFLWAILRFSANDVSALLAQGANPNGADLVGDTPLMYATVVNDLTKIKMLLLYGADWTAQNKKYQTAYDWACAYRYDDIQKFFERYAASCGVSL